MFGRKKRNKKYVRRSKAEERKPFSIRRFARVLKWAAIVLFAAWLGMQYHFRTLDRMIQAKFDQPRKWDLPSRVYSDAEFIYPGYEIKAGSLSAKLDRLRYRNTGEAIAGPGDYSVADSRIDIYLHDFEYPGELFKGFPVRLALDGNSVSSMVRLDVNEGIDLVRLEPEEITAIFNDAMEDRTVVALSEVPRHLIEAILVIEDERFFQHGGVDPLGILRAMIVNITHLRVVQGGSTLTQQLVKNFFLYPKRSFVRKMNEVLIAWRIEKAHTKEEIIEAYLNEIYLGQRGASSVSGVEEASRLYFAKSVGQLTTGEAALLAGLIRSPSEYNPITKPEKAKARRDFVLKKMQDKGIITKEEYAQAVSEKIVTPKSKIRRAAAPYFVDFVKRQLADLYPQEVLQTEGMRIFTTLDMSAQLSAEKAVSEELAALEKNYAAALPKDKSDPLQACLVSLQPSTGYVRALVGGRDYASSQFDRCTQALRQPGSTFKPFVYLTALDPRRSDREFTPSTIVDDTSFEVESGGRKWSPRNYDRRDHGPVTVVTALERSYNIAASRVAMEAGLDNVVKAARDAGIDSPLSPVPSLALGAFEVTPMEMASAYTIFPNGGIRAQPLSIINVATKDGAIVEKKALQMKRAFDPAPVFITTTIMKGVMDRGTGAGARSMGFTATAAGKTGTTSNYRDAWFAGFTPTLLALAWVGYDDNSEINMSGGRAALPLWTRFMKEVQPSGGGDFAGPVGVVLVKIDPRTGGLTSSACPSGVVEAYIEGTEPSLTCEEIFTSSEWSPAVPAASDEKRKRGLRARPEKRYDEF
ncbi:MAG TPA: PBP1A family penicillin-binding protein [bacterium]|nr:PBP1A family penicillin-binding protein [bacterium]